MKIHLLGSLRVLTGGSRTLVLTGVCSRLLGLVALRHEAAGAVSRARLAGTLWPEAPEDQARHLLSNALYRLRRLLDSDGGHLDAGPEHVGLREIWLDTTAFRSGLASERLEDWLAAFDLYAGDLLEEEDAAWVHESRAELLRLYLRALARACAALESRDDLEKALLVAHRWTLADPLEEAAHAAAMRLYGRMGRLDAALGQYEHLAGLLQSELGAEPLPETQALVETLRRQRSAAVAVLPPASRRFVGRQKERTALLQRLEDLRHNQGGLVLVEGEPGIGKTRLMEEFAEASRWRGLHVVWGRADETQRTPYSRFRRPLRRSPPVRAWNRSAPASHPSCAGSLRPSSPAGA